jgi:hypothetical protein
MEDLRRVVAKKLRETLHGREIDTMKKGMPQIEHMLGIVPIGAISTKECEEGTILDPNIEFWNEYEEEVKTKGKVRSKIETAMNALSSEGTFNISWPYGKDGGIAYVEVGDVSESANSMVTECDNCGASIPTRPNLKHTIRGYKLLFDLDCPSCDFDKTVGQLLQRK